MKTLDQAIQDYRDQLEKERLARVQAEEHEKAIVRYREIGALKMFTDELQPFVDFPLLELNWDVRTDLHHIAGLSEMHCYELKFNLGNRTKYAEVEDYAVLDTEQNKFRFFDGHNNCCEKQISELTWRVVIRDTYGFSDSIIKAASEIKGVDQ